MGCARPTCSRSPSPMPHPRTRRGSCSARSIPRSPRASTRAPCWSRDSRPEPVPVARGGARAGRVVGVVAVVSAGGLGGARLDAGVPPLEVSAPAVFHTGQTLRINLEAGSIANLSSGDRQPVRNLTEALLARLRGLLAG